MLSIEHRFEKDMAKTKNLQNYIIAFGFFHVKTLLLEFR